MGIKKRDTRLYTLTIIICCLLILYVWPDETRPHLEHFEGVRRYHPEIHCSNLPGADDIVLLLKTGVNEVPEKLPVHLRTTLQCASNTLVFSDVEQEFEGVQIHNALSHLPEYLEKRDTDLAHYTALQEAYKNGTADTMGRKAGWKLDRFKYIPMLQRSYAAHKRAKWFVFIETDTALIWSNLVSWLGRMNPDKPLYMGSPVAGGNNTWFAHGGSGFVVSRGAAKLMADAPEKKLRKYFRWNAKDCCGDSAMANAFKDLGLLITDAYPHSNGETPGTMENYHDVWCHAPVFFHHMDSHNVELIHDFDQEYSASKVNLNSIIPRTR